jgi:potassium-transporting ATPase KdpC subunit
VNHLRAAVVVFVLLTLITGVAYPVLVTLVAQTVFAHQADGSLIVRNGKPIGSTLIGQPFSATRYFWSRPSATGPVAYNAAASSGSNLGSMNPALQDAVQARVEQLRAADPENKSPIPVDLVTASASGLDPHISPAAAEYQVARVARERRLDVEAVRRLVQEHTERRTFGILGEPRVNVLELNLALDALATVDPNNVSSQAR